MSYSRFHPVPNADDDLVDMSAQTYGEKHDHTALPVPSLPQAPPKQWVPASIKPPSIATLLVAMVCYIVGLEVALLISTNRNGFSTNAIDRVNAGQFVDSFLPVIIILPLVFMLTKVDLEIRRLQPYIAISEGNASADKSILLDYVGNGRFYILWQSLKNGHFPVLLSTLVVLTTMLFQPLAAGMFSTRLANVTEAGNVTGTTAVIGLRPGFLDLNAFAAASGYADAASVHGLSDPPFINGGWSTGRFEIPQLPNNTTGVVNVTTTGIQTVANCHTADSVNLVKAQDGSYTVTPQWGSCSATVAIPLRPSPFIHYSVNAASNCGNEDKNAPVERKPIAFIFFNFDGPTPVGQSFFCVPTIQVFGISAVQSISTGLITSVKGVATYDGPGNNVTALSAQPYNGVFFPASTDPFVQARALAIQSGVPGAIFRTTFDYIPGGNSAALQDVDYMFKLTTKIYTQHLAISAAEIYFLKERVTLPAQYTLFQPRLFIYAPPVHSLVALLILTTLLTAVIHISHYRLRRKLFLSTSPGTIGSAVSLTSQARFGALLNATDSRHDMSRKLKGLRFGYDPNTWQIIVEGEKAEKAQLLNKGGLETPGTPVTPATKRTSGRESYFGSIVSPKPSSSHFPRESQMLTPGVATPLPPSPLSPRFNQPGPAAQQQQPRPSLGATPEQPRTSTTVHPPPPGAAHPGFFPSGPGAYSDPYHPDASKRA